MPRFLLWNVLRKRLDGLLGRLADQHQIDVLVLVGPPPLLGPVPTPLLDRGFSQASSQKRFGLFFRGGHGLARLASPLSNGRADFWRLTSASGREGLLVAVHGQDRRNAGDETRAFLLSAGR
jgi:hypothetical protein